MHRVRFNSTDSYSPFPSVHYDSPSAIDEIKVRFAASQRNEPIDSLLEACLARQLESWRRRGSAWKSLSHKTTSIPEPWKDELKWSTYIARFAVHFVKGIFVGAGMYTTDMLLTTTHKSLVLTE